MWALIFIIAAPAWHTQGIVDGIVIESRKVEGSRFEAVRLTKRTHVPANIQADAIWHNDTPATKEIVVHRVIEATPDRRLIYEVVSAPVIADRDAVIQVERTHQGDGHRITFRTVQDPRMPPQKGKIRMTVDGFFDVKEDGKGSVVSYEVFTDLGGQIPGWMVNKAKRDALVGSFKTQLALGAKRQNFSLQ